MFNFYSRYTIHFVFLSGLLVFTSIFSGQAQSPQARHTGTSAEVRALVLVDSRLYTLLKDEIDAYTALAAQRRQFEIIPDHDKTLDDYSYSQISGLIEQYRSAYPALEGVLAIGNIKLPSFYKARADILQVRLYPAYYEDRDLALSRYYQAGATDPWCDGSNDGYCQVIYEDGFSVPEHDFDDIGNYPTTPDLWTAFLPAGAGENDSYPDFAAQLQPYFAKLLNFYQGSYAPDDKMYMVSNDLFGGDYNFWQLYGNDVGKVDFYAMNPSTDTTCIESGRTPEECYQRAPLENYPSHQAFMDEYNSRYWMGEGWQKDSIYVAHLENNNYEFVLVNVHSWEQGSLIASPEAYELQNGGMIMLGFGCSVAGFKQPASPSHVTTSTYPADNILMNYLLGSSNFLAAAGAPFNRGHAGHFERIIDHMKNDDDYLGKAHLRRMNYLYDHAGDRVNLKEQLNEMLVGDPFLDVTPNPTSAMGSEDGFLPDAFELYAYPNPFNAKATIRYTLPVNVYIELSIYNIIGQKVVTLVSKKQTAGTYKAQWDASGFSSGVFIFRMTAGQGLTTARKLVLIK